MQVKSLLNHFPSNGVVMEEKNKNKYRKVPSEYHETKQCSSFFLQHEIKISHLLKQNGIFYPHQLKCFRYVVHLMNENKNEKKKQMSLLYNYQTHFFIDVLASKIAKDNPTSPPSLWDFLQLGVLYSYETFCTLLERNARSCFFLRFRAECFNLLPSETLVHFPAKATETGTGTETKTGTKRVLPGFTSFVAFFSDLSTAIVLLKETKQNKEHEEETIRFILRCFQTPATATLFPKKGNVFLPEHLLCVLFREWLQDSMSSSSSMMIQAPTNASFLQRIAETFVNQFKTNEDASDFVTAAVAYLHVFFTRHFAGFPKRPRETALATFIRMVFLSPTYLREIELFALNSMYYLGIQTFATCFHLQSHSLIQQCLHFFQEQLFFLPKLTDLSLSLPLLPSEIPVASLSHLLFFCEEWKNKITDLTS